MDAPHSIERMAKRQVARLVAGAVRATALPPEVIAQIQAMQPKNRAERRRAGRR